MCVPILKKQREQQILGSKSATKYIQPSEVNGVIMQSGPL